MLNYYKANYPREPYTYDEKQKYPPVKCPVLMFHGLKDTALLPGALNDTWKWIDKDLTLVTIPGAEPLRAAGRRRQGDQVHGGLAEDATGVKYGPARSSPLPSPLAGEGPLGERAG